MKKAFDIVKRLDIIASGILLILIFIDVILQVLTRFLPDIVTVKWTVEMGSILMCALLWVGMGQGIANDKHIRFTMVVEFLPSKVQKYLRVFSDLVFAAFCAVLAYHTVTMLQFYADHNNVTTILQWGKQWTKLPMLIGLIIGVIRLLLVALSTIKHLNDPEPDTQTKN